MQSWNARSFIVVTELGIVADVRLVQPSKAPHSIFVTELGIVISVKPVQPEKASSQIPVTESGIILFLHPLISVFVRYSIKQFPLE